VASVPVPYTWVAGNAGAPTAAELNGVNGPKGVGDFLLGPPRCFVYQTSATTLGTSGTSGLILWDTQVDNTDSIHSTSVNPGRFTATTPGRYLFTVQLAYAVNSTGNRQLDIRKNSGGSSSGGTAVYAGRTGAIASLATTLSISLDVTLAEDDHLEVFGTQSSGGSLATSPGVSLTFAQMRWVATS
jgi:hypothetical protein